MGHKPKRARSSYGVLLDRLFAARRFGVVLGVSRMQELSDALGNPHRRIKTRVVIAGTNGKGSCSAFLEAIAIEAGVRTAVFSSPHLARFAERFRIDGEPASVDSIVASGEAVWSAGGGTLTFFEQCTAIALHLFAALEVELAVFEVGLGGRLDATKVACPTLVAVTGVALDHQEILGSSLADIAREKVGAAADGRPLVVGRGGAPGSLAAILDVAQARSLEAIVAPPARDRVLGLRGPFQRENAEVAATAATRLGFDEPTISRGLSQARLAARFEVIETPGPEVVLDGAHNRDGAIALAAALGELPTKRTVVALGISADKDGVAIAQPLAAFADEFWAVAGRSDRAMDPHRLAARLRGINGAKTVRVVTLGELQRKVLELPDDHRVVITGSLLLVGEVRAGLLGELIDAEMLSDPAARK